MTEPVKILTNRGNVILVDETDADLMKEVWSVTGQGYAERKKKEGSGRRNIRMHRLILSRKLGRDLVKGEQVDHINRNKLDNRRSNLRLSTQQQNTSNRSRSCNNTSGYTGVCYNKRPGRQRRWEAQIRFNGKRRHLGFYLTAEEAARAYDDAAKRYRGEFACLNFPIEVSNG